MQRKRKLKCLTSKQITQNRASLIKFCISGHRYADGRKCAGSEGALRKEALDRITKIPDAMLYKSALPFLPHIKSSILILKVLK